MRGREELMAQSARDDVTKYITSRDTSIGRCEIGEIVKKFFLDGYLFPFG